MAMGFMVIDGDKLRRALEVRNLQITKVSVELGRGSTYLTDSARTGKLQIGMYKILNALYHITEEEICPDKPKTKETKETKESNNDTDILRFEKKLDKIIKLLEEQNKINSEMVNLLK